MSSAYMYKKGFRAFSVPFFSAAFSARFNFKRRCLHLRYAVVGPLLRWKMRLWKWARAYEDIHVACVCALREKVDNTRRRCE